MGEGLTKILKLYGAMTVSANGNTEKYVWNYHLNKSQRKKDMTEEEFKLSEKAKYEQLKQQNNDTPQSK